MIRKCMILYSLMLMLVNPAWSGDMDEATLETILNKRDTIVIVYFMDFNTLTRIAVTKERMRESAYECKLLVRDNTAVKRMKELIFAALQIEDDPKYDNVRLLIDIISDGAIVYSLGLPSRVGIVDKQIILKTFYDLLGLYPSDSSWSQS